MQELDIYILGINHHCASVDLREKAACSGEDTLQIMTRLTENDSILEVCVLSTCNRSEVYVYGKNSPDMRSLLQSVFQSQKPELTVRDFESFYFYEGPEAVRHLFTVAAGMDSMIIGEPQIMGQVKDAFQFAQEQQMTGICLNRLFEMTFQAAKRVRTETAIAEGAVSVAYAAVELAQKIFKDLSKQKVLLIGSGETGQLIARHLAKKDVKQLFITNRTFEKAQKLAAELGGAALPFPLMRELLPEADLVIGATNSPEYVLKKDDFCRVRPFRVPRPLVLIDIAVPRDFDPEINQYDNVFLNDMDTLQRIVDQNLERRREAFAVAHEIIREETGNFYNWKKSLQLTPTIVSLRNKLEDIRQMELKKYQNRTTPQEQEIIDRVTRGMLNKILHLPLSQLKRYSNGSNNGAERIHMVREIFDLEEEHYETQDNHRHPQQ